MSDLLPEQRPDKNGNVVTRWVRRALTRSSDKGTIPPVSAGAERQGDREAATKEVYDRLMSKMPGGSDLSLITNTGAAEGFRSFTDRKAIQNAYQDKDYEILVLLELYGEEHRYHWTREAANVLREHGGDINDLTGEKIAIFKEFSDMLTVRTIEKFGPEQYALDTKDMREPQPLLFHVLQHPEDAPILESIVKRGIVDQRDVLMEFEERKADGIEKAIHDGFL